MKTRGFQLGFGILLIGLGIVYLLIQWFVPSANLAGLVAALGLLILGGAFLALYYDTRSYGFLIPGCIIGGLGVGTLLEMLFSWVHAGALGALFVLGSLGLGFIAIYLIGRAVSGVTSPWPLIPGSILAGIGVLSWASSLAEPWLQGPVVVGGIGIAFLIAYFVTRLYGLAIPGGLMLGIGVGIGLGLGLNLEAAEGTATAGLILCGIGGGFALVYILDQVYTHVSNWWPLIPGGILLLLGLILFAAGAAPSLLNWWPLILVVLGVWIIAARWRRVRT